MRLLLPSSEAQALETTLTGDPVRLDVTLASSAIRAFDNRDFRQNQVSTLANDDYGLLYHRLNLQATQGALQLGVRLDHAWYFTSPDPTRVALELEAEHRKQTGSPDPAYFRRKVNEAGLELSNRYINWLYPAKYYVAYAERAFELSLGDTYAELGRGFVLSLRKQDELASDTTLRGARASLRLSSGPLKLRLTALGGSLNPLRIDEASGRYLGTDSSVRPSWLEVTEAGMPRAVETDFVERTSSCTTFGACSFAPDRLIAGQIEARSLGLVLSTQASLLVRQPALSQDVVRSARHTLTASQALELPRLIDRRAALYVEAALQKLDHSTQGRPSEGTPKLRPGHALYLAASLDAHPLRFGLEAKHYRRFFPLLANVSTARAREFAQLAYSAPPTTEAIDNDTEFEGFNTCTTGARLKGQGRASRGLELFAWFAHYRTWAETATNEACVTNEALENRVFDVALGGELHPEGSHWLVELGGRLDHSAEELRAPGEREASRLYYSEARLRYSFGVELGGPFSLDVEGVHRRRDQRVGGPDDPWFEGRQVVGLGVDSRWSFAFGAEYNTSKLVPSTYFNGEVTFRPTPDWSASAFAGQRAGALRCVGGICRVFPPFEGARVDVTLRF